jgi:hypothetical protein
MRSRLHRAKKRAERNVASDGTSNVAEAGRNVAAERNVTRNVAGGETLPETFLAAAASGNAERMAVLFAKLVDAAGGNVQPGATDLGDITALLAQGCDLDLDILPAVRELVAAPGQPPLKSWGLPWLAKEIIRRRDARTIAARRSAPAAADAAASRTTHHGRPRRAPAVTNKAVSTSSWPSLLLLWCAIQEIEGPLR